MVPKSFFKETSILKSVHSAMLSILIHHLLLNCKIFKTRSVFLFLSVSLFLSLFISPSLQWIILNTQRNIGKSSTRSYIPITHVQLPSIHSHSRLTCTHRYRLIPTLVYLQKISNIKTFHS